MKGEKSGGRCRSVLLNPKRDARKTSQPESQREQRKGKGKEKAKEARVKPEEFLGHNATAWCSVLLARLPAHRFGDGATGRRQVKLRPFLIGKR
jgi:hypothetical protein